MNKAKYIMLSVLLALIACSQAPLPKPRGYFRIDLPEKKYIMFNGKADVPVTFEYPIYGRADFDTISGKKGWLNIDFPRFKAKIYLTYKPVKNDFAALMEQTYKFNFSNHVSKADAIKESLFSDSGNNVHGILYDLKGNTATAVQFYATDSTRNFLRGSLYFDAEPDADSLAPVIDFFRTDIIHIIETLKWKI